MGHYFCKEGGKLAMYQVINMMTNEICGKFKSEIEANLAADRLCFEKLQLFIVSRA